MFALRLDEEDRALAEAAAKAEKLNLSDSIRRAIRHYAAHLGVKQPKPAKKK
jgi:uncharacterized protein (DUF1778 family)